MWNRRVLAMAFVSVAATLPACDDEETENPERDMDRMAYWEQQATATAKKNAGFEFGCEQLTTQTLDRNDAVMVKWYSIGVTGCGKRAVYEVTCANSQCDAERKGELLDESGSAGEPAPEASDAEAPAPDGDEAPEEAPPADE